MTVEEIKNKFVKATETNDMDLAEEALMNMYDNGAELEYTPYLNQLLGIKNHYRHEDIAQTLQSLKSESSVDILFKTATVKLEYLNYDNSEALARKCTWALADIGSKKAKEALEILSKNQDSVIANFATKRLNNWESEASRKNNS